ncbi:unnamed protein product, partial [Prorocentrum cordatum]
MVHAAPSPAGARALAPAGLRRDGASQALLSPVLRSRASAGGGAHGGGGPSAAAPGAAVAVITSSRRRGPFHQPAHSQRGGLLSRGAHQEVEVDVLSLASAEALLQRSEAGSVLLFVNRATCDSDPGGRRHHLYISFKYRRTIAHHECFWVNLRAAAREPRRLALLAERAHLQAACELQLRFAPALRSWLGAAVQA